MDAMQCIPFLLYILAMQASAISIISTQPRPDTIITEGSNLTISCTSSMPWFFCLFHSPMGDKQCAIQESEVNSVCSTDSLLSLRGERNTCSLHIGRVSRAMHGGWMCLLNEISHFNSVKTIVKVEVGVPAKVGWSTELEEGVLHLTEGEEREIICMALEGYPHTDFVWSSYKDEDRTSRTRNARMFEEVDWRIMDDTTDQLITNKTGEVLYSTIPGTHLYSGSQSLLYRAQLSDNGTTIQCRGYQSQADGAVLYTSTVQLRLHVKELIVSQSTAIEEKIGIISGIILAIIFIILLFILITIILTRRRKEKTKYSTLPTKSQEDLLTPIWVPGKGSRVHVSSARQFVHDYHENDEVQGLGDKSESSGLPTHNIHDPHCMHYKGSPILRDKIVDTSLESHGGDSFEENSRNHSVGGNTLSRPTTRTTKTISDASNSSGSSIADKSAMREYQIESYISFHTDLADHVRGATEHVYSNDDTIDSDNRFSDHARIPCEQVHSPDDTLASERISDLGDVTTSCGDCESESLSKLHETHFGDSISDIPRTVIHSPLGQESLSDIPRSRIQSPRGRDCFPDIPRSRIQSPRGRDCFPDISRNVLHSHLCQEQLPVNHPPRTGNTIFDCELGCFITIEEYERRCKERNVL